MDWQTHREAMLAHSLRIAELDPAYALWAAANYEALSQGVLVNLAAKLQQELRRPSAATSPGR